MGLFTFIGLLTVCAAAAAVAVCMAVIEKYLGKRQPKLL
jgi:hypothetical protein